MAFSRSEKFSIHYHTNQMLRHKINEIDLENPTCAERFFQMESIMNNFTTLGPIRINRLDSGKKYHKKFRDGTANP